MRSWRERCNQSERYSAETIQSRIFKGFWNSVSGPYSVSYGGAAPRRPPPSLVVDRRRGVGEDRRALGAPDPRERGGRRRAESHGEGLVEDAPAQGDVPLAQRLW